MTDEDWDQPSDVAIARQSSRSWDGKDTDKAINPVEDQPTVGKKKAQERNAQGQKCTQKSGARALGQKALGQRRTLLEWTLRDMKKLPKPRGLGGRHRRAFLGWC